MAVSSGYRDQSGLTFEEKKRVLDFLPEHEVHQVGFDPSTLEFDFYRDPMRYDIAVRIRNKKTGYAVQRIIPEHIVATKSSNTSITGSTVGDIYATTLAANPNGNYVLSTNSKVSWDSIVGNNSSAAVNISNNDIVVQGRSLKDFMQLVEERLAILKPAPELE